jgi:hypothetical protein
VSDALLNRSASSYADRFSRYNVIAVVDNLDSARASEQAPAPGIEAAQTSLLGPAAERAEHTLDPNRKDAGVTGDVTKATAVWISTRGGAVIGSGMGGMVGGVSAINGSLRADVGAPGGPSARRRAQRRSRGDRARPHGHDR